MESIERDFAGTGDFVIACDEVGRGPIAGPVVGCAVVMRMEEGDDLLQNLLELGVTDSKKLTSKKRMTLLEKLNIDLEDLELDIVYSKELDGKKFGFTLFEMTAGQIDEINILQASLGCMKFCVQSLIYQYHIQPGNLKVLIDGNHKFQFDASFPFDSEDIIPVIKGDSKSPVIGLASIIAKEFRDNHMKNMDLIYPGYGLADHAGYPTPSHKEAVKNLGVTPIHRKSFKGVKEFV
jgi:ribonuclease HII